MIQKKNLTTRLIPAAERPPIAAAPEHPERMRTLMVCRALVVLMVGDLFLRLRGVSRLRRRARFEKILQDLGMVWIRVVQRLSLRSSLLSSPLGLALQDLRDEGGAQPWSTIKTIISDQMPQALDDVFIEIEEQPFAATTVSQTHRARLREGGDWVAVKVQQPFAEALFHRDLRLIRGVTRLLKWLGLFPNMRWDDLYHELMEIKIRELDYNYEASALRRLAKNQVGRHVQVPRVWNQYSGKRVLVMAFIQGALLSDYIAVGRQDPQRLQAWLAENEIQPRIIARRLFDAVYRQVFEDNFFHGDLNTYNIILMRNNRIGVIECRSAGSLDREALAKQQHFLNHLAQGEFDSAAEVYFLVASRLPPVDLSQVKQMLIKVWRVWQTRVHVPNLPYLEKSLSYMIGQTNKVLSGSNFAAQWSFSKLLGTWVHMDLAINHLDPAFNYMDHLKRYLEVRDRRQVSRNISQIPERLGMTLVALHSVPAKMGEYNLLKESMMRRQAQVVQGSASKLDGVIATGFGMMAFAVFLVFAMLGSGYLIHVLEMDGVRPIIGEQLTYLTGQLKGMGNASWSGLLIFFFVLFSLALTLKNRFAVSEFGRKPDTSME